MDIFKPADILLPGKDVDLEKWAVIACDQFTSEPEYWQQVRAIADGAYSAVDLILPEAELGTRDGEDIRQIHSAMYQYLQEEIYDPYPGAFIYVERQQADGSVRKGIVGCVDLEAYDYHAGADAPVRASEKTVEERIPSRVAVRDGAATETSHVILYADDEKDLLIGTAAHAKETGRCLYDFDLMMDGGHITGWLLDEQDEEKLIRALRDYYAVQEEKAGAIGVQPLYFAVGDGNHSLAAAKACYEKAKAEDPGAAESALRCALVELENIHDPAQVFHPIHRIVRGIDPEAFVQGLGRQFAGSPEEDLSVTVLTAGQEQTLYVPGEDPALVISSLQVYIDGYIAANGGEVDYIHGASALRAMIDGQSAGLLMPLIAKGDFFRDIMQEGCFARKTFSIGNARDKRYYLEVRNIER